MDQGKSPIVQTILTIAVGLALVAILSILAIQIIEFRFYGKTHSVWPDAVSGRASSAPMTAPILPASPVTAVNPDKEVTAPPAVPESTPQDMFEPAAEIP